MKKLRYPLNVTIDTNIFEANHFDFGTGSTMSVLAKHIQNGKVKLVLSDIVIREVEKHISNRVDEVCGKARKLRQDYLNILPEQYLTNIGLEFYIQIPEKGTIHEKAQKVFADFISHCNVERLNTGGINIEKVLDDYFLVCPPFENSEKKRKEFPDAFIAEEIKNRFGSDETVAIISQDNGFKKACGDSDNHIFYSSLGDLFDAINKQDEEYTAAIELIKTNADSIIHVIRELIDDSCIEVRGLSYDKDGIPEGYDYEETYMEHCHVSGFKLHTIDDIDEEKIMASLWVQSNISINCYFDDYDNAPWDSEEKEYIYVEQKHILEKHDARFGCRIEINRKTEEVQVIPFRIILGGNSRKSRVEVDDEQEAMFRELEDADREELGFLALSNYNDALDNDLNGSPMAQTIIGFFEQYNDISSAYEDLAISYDDFYTCAKAKVSEADKKAFITSLSSEKRIPIDFSDNSNDNLLGDVCEWLSQKSETLSDKAEVRLPDIIGYGESISIVGANGQEYTLILDELHGIPEAGSEEAIEVSLKSNRETIARGYVKLTIGYLDFDEDGGASDGIEDSIDYEVEDVLEALESLILKLRDELDDEQDLAASIKTIIEKCE